jgi:hypothetical protein
MPVTDAYAIIRDAIITKKQIVATYEGHIREMCPHAIGGAKDGKAQGFFFQFGGGSSSGLKPPGAWRCMPIEKLSDVSSRDGEWCTGVGHSKPQSCVVEIDSEVAY